MFLKLFMRTLTIYIFALSFIINLFVNLRHNFHLIKSCISGILSGLIFVAIWAIFLRILQIILNEKELSDIFLIESSQSSEGRSYDDDEDDFSMDDIYQNMPNNDDKIEELNRQRNKELVESEITSTGSIDEINFVSLENELENNTPETGTSAIGPDGKFDLTVNHQTIRTTPETGAKAARKLLNADEKN